MKALRLILVTLIFSILANLAFTPYATAADVDDATLFVEAFNAYQGADYLLAIEKINNLNQLFPDSPLRDVTLLLLARSSMKAGENEQAAKTINLFNQEFTSTPLTTTIEEELAALGIRAARGEKLKSNKQLQASAKNVRKERLAQERAAEQKREQERLARERAEQEKIARAKAETARKERERLAAEKADKESIKTALTVSGEGFMADSGQHGTVAFELANLGNKEEPFMLEALTAPEYGIKFFAADQRDTVVKTVTVAPGKPFKGELSYSMPADKVDGHKVKVSLKVTSKRYEDISFSKEYQLVAAAPLLRAVAKSSKAVIAPGEQTRYRVTLLNIGSRSAEKLTVRVTIPPQFDFLDAAETPYRQESASVFVFNINKLDSGKLSEFNLNLKARNDARTGEKLSGQIEVINGKLLQKHLVASTPVTIRN